MCHRMYNTQAHITESHTGNILSLRHGFASCYIVTIVYRSFQISGNHFNGFQLKHIRHSPSARCYIAFNGMCQGIHSCCGSQSLRHGIHQFRVYNRNSRNVIGVYANHLLFCVLINYHIINGYFSSSAGRCRQSKSGNSLVTGRSYAFQRLHICKIRIIHHNTDTFCRINGRTASQRHNKIRTGLFKSGYAMLYIGNSRICFYITEKFIRNMILFKHFNYLVCDLKTNQVLICHKEGLLKTSANSFYRDCLPAACSEIRGFVQYHPIHNYASLLFR